MSPVRNIVFLNLPIEFYTPQTGGAISTIISEVTAELVKMGHRVDVLTRGDGNPLHNEGLVHTLDACGREDMPWWRRKISGFAGRFSRWDWPYYDCYQKAVKRALKALPVTPDHLILFNDFQSPVFLEKVLPQTKIHVWLQNEQRTRMRDFQRSAQSTSTWLTCSDYIRQWTLDQYHLPQERVHVVHSGVNLDKFHPRQNYSDPVVSPKILYVGRLDRNKGVDIAVDAVRALQLKGYDISLTVAGAAWFYQNSNLLQIDPYLESLKEKMLDCNANALGHVPRETIAALFREHDIVCVLSRSNEPFGLVVLEAMASGCAVLSSNRGGLPEACGGAGELVDPEDLPSVIAQLERIISDTQSNCFVKYNSVTRANHSSWQIASCNLESILS